MAENKTKPTAKSVPEFLNQIPDPKRQEDCLTISGMMERLSGSKPKMWGDSIVGFSPRKQNLTIYIMGYLEFYSELLEDLGKFTHGKGYLYIRKLEDIELKVLETLITTSIKRLIAS